MGKYHKDHGDERRDTPLVQTWVSKILKLHDIEEADKSSQKDGIDWFARSNEGSKHSFENKIRYKEYNDVLIETIGNMNTLSEGWIYYSQADFLPYVFLLNNTIEKGYIFDLPCLQKWWREYGILVKYLIRYGETTGLYKTQNVAVPERDIPLDCVIYHPIYGLQRSIDDEVDSSYFR